MEKVIEPAEVVKKTDVEAKVEPKVEETKAEAEETIGDVFKPKVEETVPLSKFLEIKNAGKDAKSEIADLRKQIQDGATKVEISKGIKEIASEHNVDEGFLNEFAETIKAQAEKGIDDKISEKLKPIEDRDKADKINNIFNTHYDKALEAMPEYDGVANKDVIKSLSLDPANKNKTFTKLIEESYGHLLTGKSTIESSTAGSSKDDGTTVDNTKLSDPAYMKKVLANPVLKKQYNDGLIERLKL